MTMKLGDPMKARRIHYEPPIEWKPCPFCKGGEGVLAYFQESNGMASIWCSACFCQGPLVTTTGVTEGEWQRKAVELWNQRRDEPVCQHCKKAYDDAVNLDEFAPPNKSEAFKKWGEKNNVPVTDMPMAKEEE